MRDIRGDMEKPKGGVLFLGKVVEKPEEKKTKNRKRK